MEETNVTPDEAARTVEHVVERIEEAAVVDRQVLHAMLSAVLARGHVLLEDVPGTGKTVTARVIAESMGLAFKRIQFTPDLLPSDVTGSTIYDDSTGEFEFAKGPVFTNVVLADEINRAPPKTQAALLEAMEERQVSVDGTTYDLPDPFVVVATQNPIEQEGTFRLPEAQRDRFSVKTSLGYPDFDGEMGLLERRANRRSLSPSVDPVVRSDAVRLLQGLTEEVTVDEKVRRYIVEIARKTRSDQRAEIGVSPRGVQRVFEAARAAALIDGRSYVTPDDVKRLAQPTMAHRIVLTTEATVEGVDESAVVRHAVTAVDVPAVAPGGDDPEPPTESETTADDPRNETPSADPRDEPSSNDSRDDPDSSSERQGDPRMGD
ncbi:AAA family ATPase [Natrinema longum]|uniref:MoxR family ATPase n=1 Tax=Natrinema longum TaxID=370324 RepID=A0A8A2U4I1_9EURY|nr:MoxR family ATPase [Natrinema longum]MBZ6494918.1 MoxR family ATPase [Natrinema longum]QSW83784.1 MoxR family ATPase [Natrinema longum]